MNNVYLIYGPDYELIKREINKIVKDGDDVINYDLQTSSLKEALDDLLCISMFSDRKVVVAFNPMFFTSEKKEEKDIEYLLNYINDTHDNILIFVVNEEKIDERKKITKLFKTKCKVIYKEKIDTKNITSFIISEFKENGYKIDYKDANYFKEIVGDNIDILISEINKMIVYKDNDKQIKKEDIDNISSKAYKDNIFDLIEGIVNKNYKKIFEIYDDLIVLGEEPIKIIALLSSNLIFMYQVKLLSSLGKYEKEISDRLKAHPYRVKLSIENRFSLKEIKILINKLHNLDLDIKTGKIDKNNGLKNFLLQL